MKLMAVCYANQVEHRNAPQVARTILNVKPESKYRNFRAFKGLYKVSLEHEVAGLLEALRYKKEGRWFDCRRCHYSLT
jgi:hypothetical protein